MQPTQTRVPLMTGVHFVHRTQLQRVQTRPERVVGSEAPQSQFGSAGIKL
jgi:hypothetical protein